MFDAQNIKAFSKIIFWILSVLLVGIAIFLMAGDEEWLLAWVLFFSPLDLYFMFAIIYTIADTNECVNQLVTKSDASRSTANTNNWTCQCGNINPAFLAVCSCGRSKSSIPSAKTGLKECPKCGESQSASNDYCAICGTRIY